MNKLHPDEVGQILLSARELFLQKTIVKTSIKDIAAKAGCGEATVYRYFKTKQNIILEVASNFAEEVKKDFFQFDETDNGFEKIKSFYKAYLTIYNSNKKYYRFLSELDDQFLSAMQDGKMEYEKVVGGFYDEYRRAYFEGIEDGSIKPLDDMRTFYFTTTHAILNLCKYLSLDVLPLDADKNLDREKEISMLTEIFLNNLRGGAL